MKVGEYIFTNSKFELMMKKNVTIFQNTKSSKFSYFDILFCLYTQKICLYTQNCISGTVEYQTPGVGYSKSIFFNIVHIFLDTDSGILFWRCFGIFLGL